MRRMRTLRSVIKERPLVGISRQTRSRDISIPEFTGTFSCIHQANDPYPYI